MENTKKNFMLYFDMRDLLTELPLDQVGYLLLALYDFAQQEAQTSGSGTGTLNSYPDMEPSTRMAFLSISKTIRRDTEKWHQKQQNYLEAARKRQEGKDASGTKEASDDPMRKYVQNLPLPGRQT